MELWVDMGEEMAWDTQDKVEEGELVVADMD
jgi:hypothetical protein